MSINMNIRKQYYNTAFTGLKKREVKFAGKKEDFKLDKQLEEEIKSSLKVLYGGKHNVDKLYDEVCELIQKTREERPKELKERDANKPNQWYKNQVAYMLYPDQFNVGKDKDGKPLKGNFKNVQDKLDHIKELGATTIYNLPFAKSGGGDAGFDVTDYNAINPDLKAKDDESADDTYKKFVKAAHDKGINVMADLIVNHSGEGHEFFQKSLAGDKKYQDFYIFKEKRSEASRSTDPQKGVIVAYDEIDEKGKPILDKDGNQVKSVKRLMFPENCKDHWTERTVHTPEGDKTMYNYHTFYDFQPDLNWENPELMKEVLKTFAKWENDYGTDIFRLDAIPFFVDKPGTDGESLPETHSVVKLLNAFVKATAPGVILQAEACQWPDQIKDYYGNSVKIKDGRGKGEDLKTTSEVQVCYDFPRMPATWASVVSGNKDYYWRAQNNLPEVPEGAGWATFARVHDETSLEMVDPNTRKVVYDKLIPNGQDFREGLGVSGRINNFMEGDPKKVSVINSVLMSQPGMPIIYYGDEIGAENNEEYALKEAVKRGARGGVSVEGEITPDGY